MDVHLPQWTLETLHWAEIAAAGTRYTLLEGRRDQAGVPFTYAFFLPAGFWDAPHWHSAAAEVTVLQGTLRLGYGDTLHHPATQAYGIGTTLVVPAHAVHFDGADEDTVIIGRAVGPWTTTYVDPLDTPSAGT